MKEEIQYRYVSLTILAGSRSRANFPVNFSLSQQDPLTHISWFNQIHHQVPPNTSKYTGAAAFIDPHCILIQRTEMRHHRPSNTPPFLSRFHWPTCPDSTQPNTPPSADKYLQIHRCSSIELTEIHHHRPSKTPSFLSRFHKKVNGTGACHINGRNYYLPEQTRSHEFVQGPHTFGRNLDLDFVDMNILLKWFSANKKTYFRLTATVAVSARDQTPPEFSLPRSQRRSPRWRRICPPFTEKV